MECTNSKRLIIHADDFGMAPSINDAIISAWEQKAISSTSIMVPCPGFRSAAAYARMHRSMDVGIHITLTSEWKNLRWGPVGQSGCTRSLIDESGNFWPDTRSFAANAQIEEVESEMRGQIQRALDCGIQPSHVDCHMGAVRTKELAECCMKLAREYSLPFNARRSPFLAVANQNWVHGFFQMYAGVPPCKWLEYYQSILGSLPAGINELVVHPGFNDSELQSITEGHTNWAATWRQRDFEVLTAASFRQQLEDYNIAVISWRELEESERDMRS